MPYYKARYIGSLVDLKNSSWGICGAGSLVPLTKSTNISSQISGWFFIQKRVNEVRLPLALGQQYIGG
jgi:hypothetical protein